MVLAERFRRTQERRPFEMKIEASREAKQDGGAGAARSTPSGVARVLVVDDELATRKLLTAMLGEAGISCKAAACSEEGLTALETEPVDAILSDLQMPGISGMAFLAEFGSDTGIWLSS